MGPAIRETPAKRESVGSIHKNHDKKRRGSTKLRARDLEESDGYWSTFVEKYKMQRQHKLASKGMFSRNFGSSRRKANLSTDKVMPQGTVVCNLEDKPSKCGHLIGTSGNHTTLESGETIANNMEERVGGSDLDHNSGNYDTLRPAETVVNNMEEGTGGSRDSGRTSGNNKFNSNTMTIRQKVFMVLEIIGVLGLLVATIVLSASSFM